MNGSSGIGLCTWCKFNKWWNQNNRKYADLLLNACRDIGLAENTGEAKHMKVGFLSLHTIYVC